MHQPFQKHIILRKALSRKSEAQGNALVWDLPEKEVPVAGTPLPMRFRSNIAERIFVHTVLNPAHVAREKRGTLDWSDYDGRQ